MCSWNLATLTAWKVENSTKSKFKKTSGNTEGAETEEESLQHNIVIIKVKLGLKKHVIKQKQMEHCWS